ncbi:MAG: flagellar motor switch protein FliN [Armatimonadota bacterium]
MSENSAAEAVADETLAAPELPRSLDFRNLAAMLDVPLNLTVELGRAQLPLAEVLALKPGSVVELDRFPGEPLDLYANGRLVARGEIIVLNDIFGFRVAEIPNTSLETAAGA